MAAKDVVNKAMFSNPIEIVELFNKVFFNGINVLHPSRITDGPTDLCLYYERKGGISVTKREADICKIYYQGKNLPLIILCIENQTCYDSTMESRIHEYNKLIKEDLKRQLLIDNKSIVIFLNIIITYSGSKKPYISTNETYKDIIKSLKSDKSCSFIREIRPKNKLIELNTDIGILFKCIYLNKKKTEKKLYEYIKSNLTQINNNPDISYYLKETTDIDEIVIDPSKIEGSSTFMSLWTVLQDESYKEGHTDGIRQGIKEGIEQGIEQGINKERIRIINNLSNVFDIEKIAEMLNISEDDVKKALKSGK